VRQEIKTNFKATSNLCPKSTKKYPTGQQRLVPFFYFAVPQRKTILTVIGILSAVLNGYTLSPNSFVAGEITNAFNASDDIDVK